MSFTPMLPEVRGDGVPVWLARFLRALRASWQQRMQGIPDRMRKVVTFQDLVDLGLVAEDRARKQAERK